MAQRLKNVTLLSRETTCPRDQVLRLSTARDVVVTTGQSG